MMLKDVFQLSAEEKSFVVIFIILCFTVDRYFIYTVWCLQQKNCYCLVSQFSVLTIMPS